MEASALHAPAAGISRLPFTGPLLRLRSDEQLVAMFRAGSEEAFEAIHERYRQRLFAYVRQMLSKGSRQDAEDVMQDVFVRAYGALRADTRDVNVRAWLYRVAHNRCIDHLRRPAPAAQEIFEVNRKPLHDPVEEAQRRDDLRRLVDDVGRLPDQQRSALLMREIDGMAYADIAVALDVTVPAVKSLLVRARVGLAESAEAREESCAVIRDDLAASYDRGVKASALARRHMRDCSGCREYRTALRSVKRSFAALSPGFAFGPVALAAKLGLGSAGAGSAGGAAVGGATVAGSATACKVAAVVCATALTAGGAVEVQHVISDRAKPDRPAKTVATKAPAVAPAAVAAAAAAAPAVRLPGPALDVPLSAAPVAPAVDKPEKDAPAEPAVAPVPSDELPATDVPGVAVPDVPDPGGVVAPAEEDAPPTTKPASEDPDTAAPTGTGSAEGPTEAPAQTAPPQPTQSGGTQAGSGGSTPPAEH